MVLAMSLWPLYTRFAARITAGRTTASALPGILISKSLPDSGHLTTARILAFHNERPR
jgi:hypothetical protein